MKRNYFSIWQLPQRGFIFFLALLAVIIEIIILHNLFSDHPIWGVILLDSKTEMFPYPFTIQSLLHVLFMIGMGEIYIRWRVTAHESAFLKQNFLPEDDQTILQIDELGKYRKKVFGKFDGEYGFLPSLIDLCILQFFSSRSVDQVVSVMNSSLEMISHRVDLRYSTLRYITWALPTIGFIGTVVGISQSLSNFGPGELDVTSITNALSMAFNTTLVALVLSAVLVFLLHSVESYEGKCINRTGNYTLRNLVNRLFAE